MPARTVRAAVLLPGARALSVRDVQLDGPGPGEVGVRVEAAGVCHSDYHYVSGDLSCRLPAVLGHEGGGVVEQVGPGVSSVDAGDHVLFLWRAGCGRCAQCAVGRPALCDSGQHARTRGTLRSGSTRWSDERGPLHHFLGVSCFAEQTVCDEQSLLKIDRGIPFSIAALAGCAVMSGVGAVVNTAGVRPGESVLIAGAGGVGLSAVMGARISGARRVIVCDRSPSRLSLAAELGATDLIDAAKQDLPGAVRAIEPDGVDHAFEVVGNPATIADAVTCIRRGGTVTVVGLSKLGARAEIDPLDLVLGEKRLQGSMYGSSRPQRDYPILFALAARGLLPIDRLDSRRYPLDDIGRAFDDMLSGDVARVLITPQAHQPARTSRLEHAL
jgi:Zn-dependent alcohol dehydrogenase